MFVLPSYSENFGIAAAEAMAAGVPCLLSESVGMAPKAKEYRAAVTCVANAEALTKEAMLLLATPARRKELAHNGPRFVSQSLSASAIAHQLCNEYRKAIDRTMPPSYQPAKAVE
jgi:glycosyltransferase involved in cell wall biosynthesis